MPDLSLVRDSRPAPVMYRELLRYLPQRFPFLLVDQITEYEPHRWARGIKQVATWEPLLVAPGVVHYPFGLIIESIGQLAIALFNISKGVERPAEILLGSMADVVLERRAPLGCRLDLYVEATRELDNSFIFTGQATVDGALVLSLGSLLATEKLASDLSQPAPESLPT